MKENLCSTSKDVIQAAIRSSNKNKNFMSISELDISEPQLLFVKLKLGYILF